MAGVNFLTACGHMSHGKRQEFILLSDVMGVSEWVWREQEGEEEEGCLPV